MKTMTIDGRALRFCRIGTVLLLIAAIVFRSTFLVVTGFIIMLIPAFFTISYAPLFAFYNLTFGKIVKKREETIDIAAVRFAQGFGSSLLALSLVCLLIFRTPHAGWILAGFVAVSTAFGAGGLCIGAQIYYLIRKLAGRHG